MLTPDNIGFRLEQIRFGFAFAGGGQDEPLYDVTVSGLRMIPSYHALPHAVALDLQDRLNSAVTEARAAVRLGGQEKPKPAGFVANCPPIGSKEWAEIHAGIKPAVTKYEPEDD
jgi:hypothetical protein